MRRVVVKPHSHRRAGRRQRSEARGETRTGEATPFPAWDRARETICERRFNDFVAHIDEHDIDVCRAVPIAERGPANIAGDMDRTAILTRLWDRLHRRLAQCAGGASEISRWRKPPDLADTNRAPAGRWIRRPAGAGVVFRAVPVAYATG